MATFTKPISKRFVTPKGVAQYPRLNTPDDRWGDAKYTVNLVFDESDPEVQQFARDLREFYGESIKHETGGKGRKAPFPLKPLVDRDTGDEVPGKVFLKLAMKAHVKTKKKEWDQRPTVVDAKRNPWPSGGPIIGGGSTLKCIFDAVSYNSPSIGAGCSVRLQAAQVIDLVEYVPQKGGEFEEEDGYEVEQSAEFEDEGTPEEGGDGEGGDF